MIEVWYSGTLKKMPAETKEIKSKEMQLAVCFEAAERQRENTGLRLLSTNKKHFWI